MTQDFVVTTLISGQFMKKLPIGIQTFKNLIEEGYAYVDKTPFVGRLTAAGKYYFLSRPRRFGKSVFLSTLKSAYRCEKELFDGLYLYDHWDWKSPHPVVHVSFGAGVARNTRDLQESFTYILDDNARQYGLTFSYKDLKNRFAELIRTLYEVSGRGVVVLVDEYDKPILDNIDNLEAAATIREELKSYYSVIKDSDPYVAFAFITGVSKFSKVSLFSGLNNLEDITLDERYSAICGYSQEELERVFKDRLSGVDLTEVARWYNGYNWLGKEVYNPFDILLFLSKKTFANYWFETATPTFLIKLLQDRQYVVPALEGLEVNEKIIGSFDVDRIEIETLLFQTGYLTVKWSRQMSGLRRFGLGFPNQEVKQGLTDYILSFLTNTTVAAEDNKAALHGALEAEDLTGIERTMRAFFSSIPHDWYRKNQLSGYEGYYASIVYCYFAALGVDVRAEECTNQGRMDLVVRFAGRVYIIEFKVIETGGPGKALQQIKDKGYAEKFGGQTVYLIGVEFSRDKKNIERFEWEAAQKSS